MSGVSMPVTRPAGRALIIGSASSRSGPLGTLQRLGYSCAEVEDSYAGMAELCRKPLAYRAMILSLASFYREELALIQAVKRRWPHVDIWLTHTDGRHAALADAMRLGADGLLAEDGLHRTGIGAGIGAGMGGGMGTAMGSSGGVGSGLGQTGGISGISGGNGSEIPAGEIQSTEEAAGWKTSDAPAAAESEASRMGNFDDGVNEPILTADELRALLADQPVMMPENENG